MSEQAPNKAGNEVRSITVGLPVTEPTEELKALVQEFGEFAEIPGPWDRELIKAIAMDIGKEVVAYIEVMYPEAIKATSSTFKLSVRNCIHNQIMAAVEVNDAGQIAARLETRRKFRREWLAAYRKLRKEA